MKSYSKPGPNGETGEQMSPIYDGSNDHEEKKVDLLSGAISPSEADALLEFILNKFSKSASATSITLSYRPEDWDVSGVIDKIHNVAKAHIHETYPIKGDLNPRSFTLLKTDDGRTYSETYGKYRNGNEILYTAVVTPISPAEYYSGETLYSVNGEGLRPNPCDMLVHRNERLNTWEIVEVLTGARYDLLIVFEEIDRAVSYDYPIKSLEYGDDF